MYSFPVFLESSFAAWRAPLYVKAYLEGRSAPALWIVYMVLNPVRLLTFNFPLVFPIKFQLLIFNGQGICLDSLCS